MWVCVGASTGGVGSFFSYLTNKRRPDAIVKYLLDFLRVIVTAIVCLNPSKRGVQRTLAERGAGAYRSSREKNASCTMNRLETAVQFHATADSITARDVIATPSQAASSERISTLLSSADNTRQNILDKSRVIPHYSSAIFATRHINGTPSSKSHSTQGSRSRNDLAEASSVSWQIFHRSCVLSLCLYTVILSVLDPRKCEYLKDYSLDFEHAYMTTYLAS